MGAIQDHSSSQCTSQARSDHDREEGQNKLGDREILREENIDMSKKGCVDGGWIASHTITVQADQGLRSSDWND